jgi:hypothetical protein
MHGVPGQEQGQASGVDDQVYDDRHRQDTGHLLAEDMIYHQIRGLLLHRIYFSKNIAPYRQ